MNKSPPDGVDKAKRAAAYACVDKHVQNGFVIGVGTGSTAKFVVQRLAEKCHNSQLKDIVCVPTSFETRQLIVANELTLGDLERTYRLDIAIDGADEIDKELNCIKGGGGCLMQEKIVMSCAKYFYVVGDESKLSESLGDHWTTIPLEVSPFAYVPVQRKIEMDEGGECKLRMAARKAGPVVTDNGNFIVDWVFPKASRTTEQLHALNQRLTMIPGLLETGLFIENAQKAYIGMFDGSVNERQCRNERRIVNWTSKRSHSVDNGSAKAVNGCEK